MEKDATEPWFPASTTKLMTTYVALSAVHDGKLTMDTPLTMSRRAAALPASKMGFRPGTLVTLDNALKMLMVKSPNDVAWMIGENISGSMDKFAAEMNAAAAKLGMHELQLGRMIIRNHNGLLGHYPGADGMKTGFTCPAGWNIVASAERDGRKLIVVIFGAPTPTIRNNEAAMLFDRGFTMSPTGQKLDALPASAVTSPPDMRDEICRRRGQGAAVAAEEEFMASAMAQGSAPVQSGRPGAPPSVVALSQSEAFAPVPVFVGPKPGWTGPVLAASDDVEEPATSPVTAYSTDKQAKPDEASGAPMALKTAVKTPVKLRPLHLTPQARARQAAFLRRVTKRAHRP
jgi:D-alanyl-D-alanine carboxypeptidase